MPLRRFMNFWHDIEIQVGWGQKVQKKIYSWIKVPLGRHCQGISICMSLKNQFLFLEFEINLFAFSFVELMISICKLNGRSLLKRDWLFHWEFIGQHNVKRGYIVARSDQFLMRFIGKKISIKNSLALKLRVTVLLALT